MLVVVVNASLLTVLALASDIGFLSLACFQVVRDAEDTIVPGLLAAGEAIHLTLKLHVQNCFATY